MSCVIVLGSGSLRVVICFERLPEVVARCLVRHYDSIRRQETWMALRNNPV